MIDKITIKVSTLLNSVNPLRQVNSNLKITEMKMGYESKTNVCIFEIG